MTALDKVPPLVASFGSVCARSPLKSEMPIYPDDDVCNLVGFVLWEIITTRRFWTRW